MTSLLPLLAGLLLGFDGPVTGLSVRPAPERTEVVISVEGETRVRDFLMEGPARVVVDLLGAQHALPGETFQVGRGGIRTIRTSQYSPTTVRIVLDLEAPVAYRVVPGRGEVRVVLEHSGGDFEPWSTPAAGSAGGPGTASSPGLPGGRAVPPTAAPGWAVRAGAPPPTMPAFQQQQAARISVTFVNTPLSEVLFAFADFAGRSIVPGADVTASVSAEIKDQPWDEALRVILEAHGLVAVEMESGIIRVDRLDRLTERETSELPSTRAFQINYATAAELQTAIAPLLTPDRGKVSVAASSNTLIVTDVSRVLQDVENLIRQLDRETPQVAISAKIIFINRTDLQEFGVTYDLKDSQGNQLNVLTPGAQDQNGDGIVSLPEEQVPIGTDVIALGGNSLAALGNARNRVASPTLTLLTSLLLGRHTLLSFVETLQSMNLSEIQASPTVTVMDNQQAKIAVGEETPVRVIEATSGAAGGVIPTAQVTTRETGIILEATPHVTASGKILLQLRAERSAAVPAESDAGFIFQQQYAESRVLVGDGETVVIGGLTVTETAEVRAGIPILMDLPLIGRLFRVTREQTVQRDLMILVTPTIVRAPRT